MNGKSIPSCKIVLLALAIALGLTATSVALVQGAAREPAASAELATEPGAIAGAVSYTGAATGTHLVWVGAFTTTEGGPPTYSVMRDGPGDYVITDVLPGVYYVMGGMDVDDSGGNPNPAIDPISSYALNPITVTPGVTLTGINIVLTDPSPPPTDTGSIGGWISYTGAISSAHNVIVIANRWGEPGPPAYYTVIFGPGPFTITSVADYTYTVAAFMDRGDDVGPPNPDEPLGWYDPNGDQNPDPVLVSGGGVVTGINITLLDPCRVFLPLVLKAYGP